jgi:hypothetical protein
VSEVYVNRIRAERLGEIAAMPTDPERMLAYWDLLAEESAAFAVHLERQPGEVARGS